MDSLEAVAIHPAVAWRISDHACRACAGRVLASADGARVKCADSDVSAAGDPEEICWCGALPEGSTARLKCARNEHPTPESPGAIVAIEDGEDPAARPTDISVHQNRRLRGQAIFSLSGPPLDLERSGMLCDLAAGTAGIGRRAELFWQVPRLPYRRRPRLRPPRPPVENLRSKNLLPLQTRRLENDRRARLYFVLESVKGVRIGRNAKNTRPRLVLEPRRLGVILSYGDAGR